MSNVDFAVVNREAEHLENSGEDHWQTYGPVYLTRVVLRQSGQQAWNLFKFKWRKSYIMIVTHQSWLPGRVVRTGRPESKKLVKPQSVGLVWTLKCWIGRQENLKVSHGLPHSDVQRTHQWPPLLQHLLQHNLVFSTQYLSESPDLRSFKREVGSAVLDQVCNCGTDAVGEFDQAQRLQVGVEKSLIEEIQWSPLQLKVFPCQKVSLLQQRIQSRSNMIDNKRLQT